MGVMTLLQLKYIVKIVECGSMNEASHELYVSQPALSSSVKELENELGIEIFTRSSQGIALTVDGAEFLTYARQVLDQASLLEERYKNAKPRKQLCSVSTQHYMFAVEAFVEMIDSTKSDEYEFTIRETRTKDIINQVANMLSEIGIIYLSDFNKDVIGKLLREKHLEFHPLFRAPLHVFISRDNPRTQGPRAHLQGTAGRFLRTAGIRGRRTVRVDAWQRGLASDEARADARRRHGKPYCERLRQDRGAYQ